MPYKFGFNSWDETELIVAAKDATHATETQENNDQQFLLNNDGMSNALTHEEHNLIQQTPAKSNESFVNKNTSKQTKNVCSNVMRSLVNSFITYHSLYFSRVQPRERKEPLLFKSNYFKVEYDDGIFVKAKCSTCKSPLSARCGVSSNFITHLKVRNYYNVIHSNEFLSIFFCMIFFHSET